MSASDEPAGTGRAAPQPESARARGMAKMREVYGFSIDPAEVPGPCRTLVTVDHLFGEIGRGPASACATPVTIGVLAAGRPHPVSFSSAAPRAGRADRGRYARGVHLTHYIGWPCRRA
jgi:hypothetical protein